MEIASAASRILSRDWIPKEGCPSFKFAGKFFTWEGSKIEYGTFAFGFPTAKAEEIHLSVKDW